MKWKPTITKIELEQLYVDGSYFDGAYIVFNCWSGYRYYRWLWFKWKRKLHENKHFRVKNKILSFLFKIPDDTKVSIKYNTEVQKNDVE